jgi:hypothetical protein
MLVVDRAAGIAVVVLNNSSVGVDTVAGRLLVAGG